jgi:hypothetical protein
VRTGVLEPVEEVEVHLREQVYDDLVQVLVAGYLEDHRLRPRGLAPRGQNGKEEVGLEDELVDLERVEVGRAELKTTAVRWGLAFHLIIAYGNK